jgi:hypothetical protein
MVVNEPLPLGAADLHKPDLAASGPASGLDYKKMAVMEDWVLTVDQETQYNTGISGRRSLSRVEDDWLSVGFLFDACC